MLPRFGHWPGPAAPFLFLLTAAAQEAPAPQSPSVALPTPTPTPTPRPVPGSTSTTPPLVIAPAVEPQPTPRPAPSPAAAAARPPVAAAARQGNPSTAVAPTPVARRTAGATPTPRATLQPKPAPTPRRALSPIETVILPSPARARAPLWPWLAGAGGAAMIGLGLMSLLRRRRDDPLVGEAPLAGAPPPPPPPPAPPEPARLTLALRATRAGVNLISATAECEVTVTNIGGAPARDVRVTVRLMSSHDGQDAELAAFYTDPVARPAAAAFTLAPGEQRRLRTVVAVAHEQIHAFDAGGRPIFAPIVALSGRYRAGDTARQVTHAYALGVERPGSPRLAPLWLDGPARQYDTVAVRAID